MRKLAWFAGGFALVCLLLCYWEGAAWLPWALGALAILSLGVWLARRPRNPVDCQTFRHWPRTRRGLFHLSRRCLALCLGGAAAFGWFTAYAALFRTPALELVGEEQVLTGTVVTVPQPTSIGGYSLTLRLEGGITAPDVLVYGTQAWGELAPGDQVACTARVEPAQFAYGDETTYYTARGVFLLAYCNEDPVWARPDVPPWYVWPALAAQKLKEGIGLAFDEEASALAWAVTLGDKSGLSEALYSALNRAGVMHAAVVSGLHISFLVEALMLLCRRKRRVALAAIPLLIFYALMAGGTPSAFRAVIMQGVLLAAPIARRESDPPSSLGLALLVLLIQNPFAAASVSLQLSFLSVAGILLASGRLYRWMLRPVEKRRELWVRPWRWVCASVSASLGAMLLTVPVVALYFGQITLAGPLANILVLWAVAGLMIGALFLGIVALAFPGLAALAGQVVGLLAHYIIRVVTWVGAWPWAALGAECPFFVIWMAAVYLTLPLLVRFRPHKGRVVLAVGGLAALLWAGVAFNGLVLSKADLAVTALDVGQGASTALVSGESTVLVDCGGSASQSAGDIAADYFASFGRTRLDLLVLTHLDDDHFNGVAQLFRRMEVDQVAVPVTDSHPEELEELRAMAEEEGASLLLVTGTETVALDKAGLTLYPPLGEGTSNEEGLFALCSAGEFDALITGDADAFVEKMLVKYYDVPDIELLLVGHHGSAGSTCTELLDALGPELAIISVGYNSYGHPAQDTLDRLAQAGTQVYRTDQSGRVTVLTAGDRVKVLE